MNHIAIFQVAKFDVREKQIDEERNQESRPEEKGPRKKEEVAFGRARKGDSQNQEYASRPRFSGAFFIVRGFSRKVAATLRTESRQCSTATLQAALQCPRRGFRTSSARAGRPN